MFKVDIKEQMIYPGGYKEKVFQISFWLKDLKLCLCNGKSRNKEPMISRWAQGESLEELIRTSGGRLLSWSVEYHAFHSLFVEEILFIYFSKYYPFYTTGQYRGTLLKLSYHKFSCQKNWTSK